MVKGRKPEFDQEVALEKATNTFWRLGYDETTYDDLVRETGVSRYGLYGAFGDKRSFFAKCLQYYSHRRITLITSPLVTPTAGLKELSYHFEAMLKKQTETDDPWGCMMCSTQATALAQEADIEPIAEQAFKRMRDSYHHALNNAQRDGDLSQDVDTDKLADQLLGTMVGAMIMARSTLDKQMIRNFVRGSLGQIE